MTVLALAPLVLLAGLFVYREAQHASERADWTDERRELLNRIKPETAVLPPRERPTRLHVGFDNDKEFEALEAGLDA